MNVPAETAATVELSRTPTGDVQVRLSGDWRSRSGVPSAEGLERELEQGVPPRSVELDAGRLTGWNVAVLAFLWRCDALCRARGVPLQVHALPEGLGRLHRLAGAVPEAADARRGPTRRGWVTALGEAMLVAGGQAADFVQFLGECVLAVSRLVVGRARMRWADALLVVHEAGPRALGIVALINFLVGLILAFVGAMQLARFGASVYVADLVAVATVREMGCIMTAIIMCGRTGAAFAAELGTMKVNEEIDAFTTFGFGPADFLVLPRLLALVLMMPLLCAFADVIAIAGGLVVATGLLDLSSLDYVHRTLEAITMAGFLLGLFKGACFGVIVALVGCWRGMRCGSDAAAVGAATTSAVVIGITGIIAADGLFAVLTHALQI